MPAVAIRSFLLADVLADLLQVEAHGGHRVAASPEVLTGKVPLLSVQTGDSRWHSSPSNTRSRKQPSAWAESRYTYGRGCGIKCPSMIWHSFCLLGQRMQNRAELPADRAENGLPPSLRDEYYVIFAVYMESSPYVGHQATWRGFYTLKDSRNGQTCSSLTGRTSGLPNSVTANLYWMA